MKIRLKHMRLAEEMAKSPVTLNRWAQRMGLRSGHLSQLANGQRLYPTAKTRQKILDATGLEFEELFEIEAAKPRTRPSDPPARAPKVARSFFSDVGSPAPRYRGKARRRDTLMSGWWFDCRSAARSLARRPGYALAAIATLALGIGANIALFTAVNAVLFKAYAYQSPERLMVLSSTDTETGFRSNLSLPNALDLRNELAGKIDVAAWDWEPFSLSGGDRPQRVGGAYVTADFDRVIGVPMVQGRFFNAEEAESEERVVVLTEELWLSSFGKDPAIVGRTVLLDGEPATVVGVAPSTLDVIDRAQLFVPLASWLVADRNSRWLGGYARLDEEVSLDQANDLLLRAAAQLEEQYPVANENRRYTLTDLREVRVGPTRTMFLTLQGVVAVVLLIVCANVANLLLSRGAARGDEMRVRSALGASKGLLARLVVFESAWLCLIGLAAGGILGIFGSRLLFRLVPDDNIPAWLQIDPDLRVATFAIGATLLTMVVSSFLPALRQAEAGGALSGGQRVVKGRASRLLVIAEVALSCVLLFGAGLLVRSLLELTERDPGFETDKAVVVGLDLLSLRNSPAEEREQQFLRYYDAFSEVAGVEAVGAIDRIPMGGGRNRSGVTVERPEVEDYDPMVLVSRVTPGYFDAIGLTRHEGRGFLRQEGSVDGPRNAVVSRSFADNLWPSGSALGKRFKFGYPDDDVPWVEIVGVVGDVLHTGLDGSTQPTVYLSQRSFSMARATWVVRGAGGDQSLLHQLRETVKAIDPHQPLWGTRSLSEHVASDAWQTRFFATTFWVFAGVAALLAAIGLYGVLAWTIAQRRREMGVRLALGASTGNVALMVFRDGFFLIVIGLVIGIPAALGTGMVLSGALFGVSRFDFTTLVLVVALLVVVGLLAASIPARRASRLDPAIMLRVDG